MLIKKNIGKFKASLKVNEGNLNE